MLWPSLTLNGKNKFWYMARLWYEKKSRCPLEVPPPSYFLSHPSTLSSNVFTFLSAFPYPVLPFVRTSPPKILLGLPARGPFFSALPSLYLSLPYFPVLQVLSWFFLLWLMPFSSLCFPKFFWICLYLTNFLHVLWISCDCLHFC